MAQPILWTGVDAGKAAHHCVALDADGQRALSRRVVNDEAALFDLIRAVKQLAGDGSVQWAIDLNSGGAALLITLLLADDQARMRRDLHPLRHRHKLRWISGYCADATTTPHRTATGQSIVCALNCWRISPPWKPSRLERRRHRYPRD